MALEPELELIDDSDLLRMLTEPLSMLTVLSISAIITTISLFFCGIPICMQIYRRRSTNEISGFPFLMGFLGGTFWLRYGLLKADLTMITVNVVGVSLMSLYLLFYLYFSRPRTSFLLQLFLVSSTILVMLVLVNIYEMESIKALGFVCMTFNILNFGAPLAGMTAVLRNRCCSTLPLPLCTANLLVSSQWCVYGFCVQDIFIIIPNGAGVVLALVQISLFLIFPRNEGDHAPLARCCPCVLDLEKGEALDNGIGGGRRRRGEKKADQYAHHQSLATRNKFLHRQRVIDRRMIPTSRAACIEYLRASGNAFDTSFGSVSSRATADSWMSGASLSRISSSLSHPELFAAINEADSQMVIGDGNFMDSQANGDFFQQSSSNSTAATSAAAANRRQLSSTMGLSDFNGAILPPMAGDLAGADECQLLTEDIIRGGGGAVGINGGAAAGDLLFVRTLSAPDLLAQQLNSNTNTSSAAIGQRS